jgi:6-bladed beta-propeller
VSVAVLRAVLRITGQVAVAFCLTQACSPARPDSAKRSVARESESLLPVLAPIEEVVLHPRGDQVIGRVMDLAVADSFILVADGLESNVKLFSRDGTHLRTYGRRGNGPAEFVEPAGVVLLPAGDRFVVLDRKRGRVSVWSLEGEELFSWPHGLLLASSIALRGQSGGLALFGTGVRGTAAKGRPIEFADLNGAILGSAGMDSPIRYPGERTFRTVIGDRVGQVLVYTHSSTNEIWEAFGERVVSYHAGTSFYVPWDWAGNPGSAGPIRQAWMERQLWTMKLFAVDSVHYLVGIGRPIPAERSYRYRYVLMRVGAGEISQTGEVSEQLYTGQAGVVYGVRELEGGGAVLTTYGLIMGTE